VTAPVVVILAAGQGTRMRSSVQKLLHPLCGRPIVAWPIAAARAAGAGRVVVVDSPERRLAPVVGDGVELAVQRSPRGTADAVKAAVERIGPDDTVVVINGDLPLITPDTLRALVQAHDRSHSPATIGTVVLEDPSGYGRVIRAPDGTVERVVETKTDGDSTEHERHIREVNTGIYAFDGDALLSALEEVRADNAQAEYYLPDVVSILRGRERTVDVYELPDPDELLQINDRVQLADVTAVAQRQIHEAHMRAGVTVVNPAATVIDFGVQIGQDTVIAPFTSLHGETRIGAGATIGPGSTVIDTTVGDGSKLLHCYVTSAEIGARVSVGPFAYLRPGTVLRDGSKAGTFVEIKNSDVGAGTKIPHLSYIGDAEIGEQTNLGAATITANYDGYRKHRTQVGRRVKTAVDTVLVAPVTVGDDAFTAAGSVIGTDVPAGALAGSPGVARTAQRNVEGYAEKRASRAAAEGAHPAPPLAGVAEQGAAGDDGASAPEAADPELEQIREWVSQGRTDAWIAYRLGVSVEQARARKADAEGLRPPDSGAEERG
jgi:bifunctional UDP-N-acetylglucosamine pyrophosphorylase/glucosamine-1-phosphate N-acetyltransferase